MKKKGRVVRVHDRNKKKKPAKTSKVSRPGQKKEKPKASPKKIFFYTLGICLAGGAGFLVYDKVIKPKLQAKNDSNDDDANTIIVNNNIPSSDSASTASSSGSFFKSFVSHSNEFPLKRGSRGYRLRCQQVATSLAQDGSRPF